jgi:amino acid adenylation domain-containing protein
MRLENLAIASAARVPNSPAVVGPDETMTYAELNTAADRAARALLELGVGHGDRVAIWSPKSARAIAAMQAVLRCGAAYVPIDPRSPRAAVQKIFANCGIKALVATESLFMTLDDDVRASVPSLLLSGSGGTVAWSELDLYPDGFMPHGGPETDLAYILYTSGSTGEPKGVSISHRAALAFVEWAASTLAVTERDRLANHAPFHFDLSVLDIYAAFAGGAAVVLVPEGAAYAPVQLVALVRNERISIWYSVPSALTLMIEQGGFLDERPPALRAILFAGEPFPIKGLRSIRDAWQDVRLLNLYGPTETNVCTYHEVVEIAPDRTAPVPIGKACCGDRVWAVKPDGEVAKPGEEGELLVEGPTLLSGYWGKPPQGDRPYATGDVVRMLEDGSYEFLGRRDHLVKVRGHRVELGAIEAVLQTLAGVAEVSVVVAGSGLTARLVAFVSGRAPSLLALKRHCSMHLPRHMIVDRVVSVEKLPRTGNGKVDKKALVSRASVETEIQVG